MRWRVLLDEFPSADEQMAFDVRLAYEASPTLRLFRWAAPTISLGYTQRPFRWMHSPSLRESGIALIKRPTGGGVAFHGSDLSFSVVMPHDPRHRLAELVEPIGQTLVRVCDRLGVSVRWLDQVSVHRTITYCHLEPSSYALMAGSRKLCGLAIRRYPESWLLQGLFLVRPLPSVLLQVIPEDLASTLLAHAVALQELVMAPLDVLEVRGRLLDAWRMVGGVSRPLEPALRLDDEDGLRVSTVSHAM